MASPGYRVRIHQPDAAEVAVLATMIAPFVDMEVGLLEDTLRQGHADVGDGLERREAEQLARLFARLGAHARLLEPGADAVDSSSLPTRRPASMAPPGLDSDRGEDEEDEEEDELVRVRQTQPFDARALREALDVGSRPPAGPTASRDTMPVEVTPREPTQPFNARSLRQALSAALLQMPSAEAPATRPINADEVNTNVRNQSDSLPPRPRLRGRPARHSRGPQDASSSEPPPRAGLLGPTGLPRAASDEPPPDPDEVGLGSVDTASLAFLSEALEAELQSLTAGEGQTPLTDLPWDPPPGSPGRALQELQPRRLPEGPTTPRPSGVPRAPVATPPVSSVAPQPAALSAPTPPVTPSPPVWAAAGAAAAGPSQGPAAVAPPSTAPRPRGAPIERRRSQPDTTQRASAAPRSVASPLSDPALGRVRPSDPPPRPSGGHSVPDRARATAIRDRVVDARHQAAARHQPWYAAALGLLPGMGQLYNGQRGRAVAFALGALAIVPWFVGIFDAWSVARNIHARRHPPPDTKARRSAVPGQIVLDIAVFVALAGAIHVVGRRLAARTGPVGAPVTVPQDATSEAPTSAAPVTAAAVATAAPPTAAEPSGPKPIYVLMAEGRNDCAEGRFAECEQRMLEVIAQHPDHLEAHRLLVDARTQQAARRPQVPPSAP